MSSYALHRDTTGLTDAELAAALLAEDDVGALLAQVEYDRARRLSSMVGLPGGASASTVFWAPPTSAADTTAASHFDGVGRAPRLAPPVDDRRAAARGPSARGPLLAPTADDAPAAAPPRSRTGSLLPPPSADDDTGDSGHSSAEDSITHELLEQRRAFEEMAAEDLRKRKENEETTRQLLAMAQSLAGNLEDYAAIPASASSSAGSGGGGGAAAAPTRSGLVRSPVPRLHTEKVAKFRRPATDAAAARRVSLPADADGEGPTPQPRRPSAARRKRSSVPSSSAAAASPGKPVAASRKNSSTANASDTHNSTRGDTSASKQPNISQLKLREEQRMLRHYRELCELSATSGMVRGGGGGGSNLHNTSGGGAPGSPGGGPLLIRTHSGLSFDGSYGDLGGTTPHGGAPGSPTTAGVYQETFILNAPFAYSVHAGQTARANPRDSPAATPRALGGVPGQRMGSPSRQADAAKIAMLHDTPPAGPIAKRGSDTGKQATPPRRQSPSDSRGAAHASAKPPAALQERGTQTPPKPDAAAPTVKPPPAPPQPSPSGGGGGPSAQDAEGDYYEPSAMKPRAGAPTVNFAADDSVDLVPPRAHNDTFAGVASADIPTAADAMSPRNLDPVAARDGIGDSFDDGVVSTPAGADEGDDGGNAREQQQAQQLRTAARDNSLRRSASGESGPEPGPKQGASSTKASAAAGDRGGQKRNATPSQSALKPADKSAAAKSSNNARAVSSSNSKSKVTPPNKGLQPSPSTSKRQQDKSRNNNDDKPAAADPRTPSPKRKADSPQRRTPSREGRDGGGDGAAEALDDTVVFHPGMATQPLPPALRTSRDDRDDGDDGSSLGSGSYTYDYSSDASTGDTDSMSSFSSDDDDHTRRPHRGPARYASMRGRGRGGGRAGGPLVGQSVGRGGVLQRAGTTGALRGRGGRGAQGSSVVIRGGYRTQDGVVVRVVGGPGVEVTPGQTLDGEASVMQQHATPRGGRGGGGVAQGRLFSNTASAAASPRGGFSQSATANAFSASAVHPRQASSSQPTPHVSQPPAPVVILRGGHRPGGMPPPPQSGAAPPLPSAALQQRSVSMGAMPPRGSGTPAQPLPPRSASVIVRPAGTSANASMNVAVPANGTSAANTSTGRLFGGPPPAAPGPVTVRSSSAVMNPPVGAAGANTSVSQAARPPPPASRPTGPPSRSTTPPPPATRPDAPPLSASSGNVVVKLPDGTFVPASQQQQGAARRLPPPPPDGSPTSGPHPAAPMDAGQQALLSHRSQTMIMPAPRSLYL